MLSNKPYLLRAFYQWIVDSQCTPILAINASYPALQIPQEFVEGDEVLFNISPSAVRDLKILNDVIEFKASFSGVIHIISVPFRSALGVYAEENGEGIFFDADDMDDETEQSIDRIVPLREVELTTVSAGLQEADDDMVMSRPESLVAKSGKPILKLVE